MLSNGKKIQKPSLIGVKSFQEAVNVLNSRKAPQIYTAAVSNIFKADMANPASKTWIEQSLRETENTLKKDEDDKEATEKKLTGYQNDLKETEENPSSGAEPTPKSIADKSGVSAQNDGASLDDIKDKNPIIEQGSEGAHAQTGESQLKEAIQKVFNVGFGVDPLNQSIINGMSNGMSKAEASNAANADNTMMEAVFHKMAAKLLVPIFKAQSAQVTTLQETIRVYDQKLESARRENKGLNETINLIPGQTIIPVPASSSNIQSSEIPLEEHRNEISKKLKDQSFYG